MSELDVSPLFEPFKIRNLTFRNRFVMPAMQRGQAKDCVPSDLMVPYYRKRAEGGTALIISEACGLDHPTAFWQPIFSHISPKSAGVWGRTIEGVKSAGANFFLQLWHPGASRRLPPESPMARYESLSPSGLLQTGYENGKAMTASEMDDIKGAFVRGAEMAKSLGADGVELHSAHGYLLDEFFWHETNVREDEYGGTTLAERAKYPAEVVAAIRSAVGDDFIISCRLSQFKEVDYQARLTEDPMELKGMLDRLRNAGADSFHISTRRFDSPEWPDETHQDWSLSGWVKSLTDAAVITIGGVGLTTDSFSDLRGDLDTKLQIEQDLVRLIERLQRGQFDFVALGRSHIANADLVNKIRDGRLDELVLFKKALHLKGFLEDFDLEATTGGLPQKHQGGNAAAP